MSDPLRLSCSEKEAEQLFSHGRVEVRRPEHGFGPLFPENGALVGIYEPWAELREPGGAPSGRYCYLAGRTANPLFFTYSSAWTMPEAAVRQWGRIAEIRREGGEIVLLLHRDERGV